MKDSKNTLKVYFLFINIFLIPKNNYKKIKLQTIITNGHSSKTKNLIKLFKNIFFQIKMI